MAYKWICFILLGTLVDCKGPNSSSQAPQPTVTETWDTSPDPTTTKIKVITNLSQQAVCFKLQEALAIKRFQIAANPYSTPRYVLGDDGTSYEIADRYDTKPKLMTGDMSYMRLHMSIDDSVVVFSAEVGVTNDVVIDPEVASINWQTLEKGDNPNNAFHTMNDIALTFSGTTRLFNRYR